MKIEKGALVDMKINFSFSYRDMADESAKEISFKSLEHILEMDRKISLDGKIVKVQGVQGIKIENQTSGGILKEINRIFRGEHPKWKKAPAFVIAHEKPSFEVIQAKLLESLMSNKQRFVASMKIQNGEEKNKYQFFKKLNIWKQKLDLQDQSQETMMSLNESIVDINPNDLEKGANELEKEAKAIIDAIVEKEFDDSDIITFYKQYEVRNKNESKGMGTEGHYINWPTNHSKRDMNLSGFLACERFVKAVLDNSTLAIDGINVPWVYLGTNFTSFPIHIENLKFFAYNCQLVRAYFV